ncbi:MAG: BrnT family toxin, partial [Hydrococcus sp. CRU_1_1]|nr:BrnT family toxin [Hydrococcus sp. CRU_1_1]
MEFEWDENKNQTNIAKHKISFEEASEIFRYPMYEMVDNRTNYAETRYIGIGQNNQMVIITVV